MFTILIAASPGIEAEEWLARKISEATAGRNCKALVFGKNEIILRCLDGLSVPYSMFPVETGKESRSKIREALANSDYLLLFWDGRTYSSLLFEARLKGMPTKVYAREVTVVANKDRGDDHDVYIGRGTPWGNPFVVGKQEGQFSREEAIDAYRAYFYEKIGKDPGFKKGILGFKGLRIACHCKPLACHGDVIVEYLNKLDPENNDH